MATECIGVLNAAKVQFSSRKRADRYRIFSLLVLQGTKSWPFSILEEALASRRRRGGSKWDPIAK